MTSPGARPAIPCLALGLHGKRSIRMRVRGSVTTSWAYKQGRAPRGADCSQNWWGSDDRPVHGVLRNFGLKN